MRASTALPRRRRVLIAASAAVLSIGPAALSPARAASWTQTEASGFRRLSVGRDGAVWAVGTNETLWRFVDGRWTQTPASGMGDVAAGPDGRVWLAGRNGTVWHTADGRNFTRVEASGFESVAAGPDGAVWAVGANGTLWVYR